MQVEWLEPLLAVLIEEPTAIIQPVIDEIDPESFNYSAMLSEFNGGFDWNLRYIWYKLPNELRNERPTEEAPLPDFAPNSHHACTEMESLREQVYLLSEDFEKNVKDIRNKMRQFDKERENVDKKSRRSIIDVIDNPIGLTNAGIISTIREGKSSKIDEELNSLLQEIVSRNTESTSRITQVNNTANQLIPVRRDIPDTRHKDCSTLTYPDVNTMPTVSVVIIFCDEPLQLILRNIHSILDKSPSHLIHEIILVDDNSTLAYLKDDLDLYVSFLSNVKIIHNKKREGLIKSRMIGARSASGEVLVFFDAHMECNVQWLEPLLAILMEEQTAILQPVVDIISDETIEYYTLYGEIPFRGGFGWDLRYSWFKLPLEFRKKSPTDPFWTPVLVGNAIVVKRLHFFRIGGFDEDLKIWGGEHFDISFRNWLCAGHVYTVPCSRVGHLFKKTAGYSYEGDRETIVVKNLMRVAEIWLENYKDIFYRVTKSVMSKMPILTQEDVKSIEKRIHLKRTLNCKPFQWYLNNVLPDQVVPRKDAMLFGEITHVNSQKCFSVNRNRVIFTDECFVHRILPYNTFTFTKTNQLMYEDSCVYIDTKTMNLRVNRCVGKSGLVNMVKGKWKFTSSGRQGQIQFVTEKGKYLCVNKPDFNGNPLAVPSSMNDSAGDIWEFMYRLADTGK
ncbi:polypeptide N-acetylgalactosaminyltransferase 1-like [Argopecten irradians]|uniref:polypeptide N-acetylgalactosaminyltransferase 1-like n=1 Tax=Argopecten irradians TaxID=31199 RepID=UPI0037153652